MNKSAILILTKEIKKIIFLFLTEALYKIISFSMLYHIAKFHLTNNFLYKTIISTIYKGHYFKIHKVHYVD